MLSGDFSGFSLLTLGSVIWTLPSIPVCSATCARKPQLSGWRRQQLWVSCKGAGVLCSQEQAQEEDASSYTHHYAVMG